MISNSEISTDRSPESIEREIFEENTNDKKDFFEYTEECFNLSSKVVIPTKEEIKDYLIELPFLNEMRKQKKKLAVWDLDETLIHCNQDEPDKADIQLIVKFSEKSSKRVRQQLITL